MICLFSLQSPPSMKSCIMAAWLLTVSFGNLLVVILAGVKVTDDMVFDFQFYRSLHFSDECQAQSFSGSVFHFWFSSPFSSSAPIMSSLLFVVISVIKLLNNTKR